MSQFKTNQKGFSVVESLLIILAVAIIGGTSYYVYHASKKANNTLNTNTASQTSAAKTEVFLIPEWKVSAAIQAPPAQAALVQYVVTAGSQLSTAQFTTQELVDLDKTNCSADSQPAGVINREVAGSPFSLEDGTDSGKTVAQEFATSPIAPYKVIDGYYYWYTSSQAACNTTPKGVQLQLIAATQVKAIVSHLVQEQ